MNAAMGWSEHNLNYLAAALESLRPRLRRRAVAPTADRSDEAWNAELARAEQTAEELAAGFESTPALPALARRLGLTRFERDVLLLCAAMELDTRLGALCAEAQGDPHRPHPTFALA